MAASTKRSMREYLQTNSFFFFFFKTASPCGVAPQNDNKNSLSPQFLSVSELEGINYKAGLKLGWRPRKGPWGSGRPALVLFRAGDTESERSSHAEQAQLNASSTLLKGWGFEGSDSVFVLGVTG